MSRIQLEVTLSALAAILCAAAIATGFDASAGPAQTARVTPAFYVTFCVVASAVLAGVAAGLRRRLPFGAGVPAGWSLSKLLAPILSAGVTAIILTSWSSFLLTAVPETATFQHVALQVARGLDIGILTICVGLILARTVDFRRANLLRQARRPQ